MMIGKSFLKSLLTFFMILSIIVMVGGLVTGGLLIIYMGQYERGMEDYKLFEQSGDNQSVKKEFFLEAGHDYAFYIEISGQGDAVIVSANVTAYINGELHSTSELYDEEHAEEDSVVGVLASDLLVLTFEPLADSELNLSIADVKADIWIIRSYRDLPIYLTDEYYISTSAELILAALGLLTSGGVCWLIFAFVKEQLEALEKEKKKQVEKKIRKKARGDFIPAESFLYARRKAISLVVIVIGVLLFIYGLLYMQYFDGQVFSLVGFFMLIGGILGYNYRRGRDKIAVSEEEMLQRIEWYRESVNNFLVGHWRILVSLAFLAVGMVLMVTGAAFVQQPTSDGEIVSISGLFIVSLGVIGYYHDENKRRSFNTILNSLLHDESFLNAYGKKIVLVTIPVGLVLLFAGLGLYNVSELLFFLIFISGVSLAVGGATLLIFVVAAPDLKKESR